MLKRGFVIPEFEDIIAPKPGGDQKGLIQPDLLENQNQSPGHRKTESSAEGGKQGETDSKN
jgi:hypothetical protein